ncbi:hypothetical protein [Gluconacetobacter takamatsuzukensis]|uniref:Uncharacterized protein n=1 Tax=Gluconacetobacter takamatsuzukensis TaxID=1286190 RepID=A0A7W4KGL8_9PROT|nr:hypothetical protein [Gluconacetobacter takamatsuzukensis]MBB2206445.1 hypothetical protein [Gluconacetobacter takamatsuzukensis]
MNPTQKWYIDALDPRSGRAFASYRDGDLQDVMDLDAAQVTYFLEPPAFAPVQVSRSIAFSATRYQFQAGLFDEDGELPFNQLDDVVEFVRRSYLRRGGGGGGGPEPSVTPEPPPGPTEGPADLTGEDPLIDLRGIVKQFKAPEVNIPRGAALPVGFIDTEAKGSGTFAKRRLGRGALALALEQIAVFQTNGDFESSTRQRSRLLRLFQAIASAGLAEEAYAAAEGNTVIKNWLTQRFDHLKPFGPYWPLPESVDTSKIIPSLILAFLATGGGADLWPEVLHGFFEPDSWRWFGWYFSQREDDPVGLLAELAVPAELADAYKAQADAPMSVGQFLFSFLAAPQLAAEKSDLAIEVALFASACLVLPSVQSRLPDHGIYRRETRHRAALVAFEAEKWLRGNMPQKIFSEVAEALLTERNQMAVV